MNGFSSARPAWLSRILSRYALTRHVATAAEPQMPPCSFTPEPYQGRPYDEVASLRQRHLNPSLSSNLMFGRPLLVSQGHMQWLWDHTGKRYLDMFAGIVTVSVGHCHPKVLAAAEHQLKRLWHTSNIYMYPSVHEFAEKLTAKLPGNLKMIGGETITKHVLMQVCYFTNSGSEANDLAMMLARLYTGAFDIIALRNAYHGMSPYSGGMCGVGAYRHHWPTGFGVHHVMNADPYRGPWGGQACRDCLVPSPRQCSCPEGGPCSAASLYADQVHDVLRHNVSKKRVAAFFAESIQGVGGTVQFPKGYLQKVYELIRERGGLCIADEVQTGFGRMGDSYWGFESHGVVPDIVTMAKGIGNGFPLAAVVTTPEIASALNAASFFNTFGGNPVACAVGSAVVEVIDEDGCMANSRERGQRLLLALAALQQDFPVVGDVRGKGLMLGVELVQDRETKEPLPAARVGALLESCREMGLLIGKGGLNGNVLRIKPPMCITDADVDFTVAVLRRSLERVSQQ